MASQDDRLRPGALADALVRLGVQHEESQAKLLAEQRGHPAVVLSQSVLDPAALELVPRAIAEKHRVLPVATDDETLTIAMAEVTTPPLPIVSQMELATGRRVL